MGRLPEVTFLDSESYPFDHSLFGFTYRSTLEELGSKFKEQYLLPQMASGLVSKGICPRLRRRAAKLDQMENRIGQNVVGKNYSHIRSRPVGKVGAAAAPPHATPVPQKVTINVPEKIRAHIQKGEFQELGICFSEYVSKAIVLDDVEAIAKEMQAEPVLHAVQAVKSLKALNREVGLKTGQMLQLALFCETDFQKKIKEKKYFLRPDESKLCRQVEYDSKTKRLFIHLGTHGVRAIGEGFHKVVTKSILYDRIKPEIVACCKASLDNKREMDLIRSLQGVRGVVEGRAFITHNKKHHKEDKVEMILKLYNARCLRGIYYTKSVRFTMSEKMG